MVHGSINTSNKSLTGRLSAIPTLTGYVSTSEITKVVEIPMEYQETSNLAGGITVYIGKERND